MFRLNIDSDELAHETDDLKIQIVQFRTFLEIDCRTVLDAGHFCVDGCFGHRERPHSFCPKEQYVFDVFQAAVH